MKENHAFDNLKKFVLYNQTCRTTFQLNGWYFDQRC